MGLLSKTAGFVAIPILMNVTALKGADAANADMKIVADLDTQYQKAVEQNDAETMDKILADDFVLVTGLGKIYTKADLLADARSKRAIYEVQNDSRRTVRVWGDTAIVTALLWAKGVEDGKPFEYRLWFSDTYVKTGKGWRYVFAQASTRLTEPPGN
jgi:ketosteroid isomerase-like protein